MNQIPQLDNQYKKSSPHRESVFSQLFQVVFFKKLWQQVTQQGATAGRWQIIPADLEMRASEVNHRV